MAIPRRLPGTSSKDGHKLYRKVLRNPLLDLATATESEPERQEAISNIRDGIAGYVQDASIVVLSDEDLLGPKLEPTRTLYPAAAKYLQTVTDLFPDRDLRVVLYIRDLASYVESSYVQGLQMRRPLSFDEFLDRIDIGKLSWTRVADRIADQVGADNLVVKRFETIRDGFEDFARDYFSLFCDPDRLELKEVQKNVGLSGLGTEIARAVAPMLTDEQWYPLRTFLQRQFSTANYPAKNFLSEGDRELLTTRYQAEWPTLTERFKAPANADIAARP